jgi:predicted nucleic acid-binding protein
LALVYLDTSVWLALATTYDVNHHKALRILRGIQSGPDVVMISRHMLCEVLDVLRRKAATYTTPGGHRNYVETIYRQFTATVLGQRNVRFGDPSNSAADVLKETVQVLQQVWGKVIHAQNCPICNSRFVYHSYDGPGRDDTLHVAIANALGCVSFITFDQDFNLFKGVKSLSKLSIQVK